MVNKRLQGAVHGAEVGLNTRGADSQNWPRRVFLIPIVNWFWGPTGTGHWKTEVYFNIPAVTRIGNTNDT